MLSTTAPRRRAPSATAGAALRAGRRYAGVSDEQRRSERYERFMAAGLALFGTEGYERTTTRALCAVAGLTQRYFYESFENTEALFVAVADRHAAALRARLLRAIGNHPDDPEAMVRAGLRDYFSLLQGDRRVARLLLVEVYTATPRTHDFARGYLADLAQLVHESLAPAHAGLAAAGIDARLLCSGLIGAGHHIGLSWTREDCRTPIETIVETTLRLYAAALPGLVPGARRNRLEVSADKAG